MCPICGHDNNTEFAVFNHKTFSCFACGASGDIISFVEALKQVDFHTAIESLADELNLDITRDKGYAKRKGLAEANLETAKKYNKQVKKVSDYLHKERGLTDETIDMYMLGADEENNVTIPYFDENGRCVGMCRRRFEKTPKYVNNKNSEIFTKSEFLFGFREAKKILKNTLYLVEGYFCAMSLMQDGLPAVAYNSSQPTKQQLMKLNKLLDTFPELTVILIPDNDDVAIKLLSKVRRNVLKYSPKLPVEVLSLEKVKDVNELYSSGGSIKGYTTQPLDMYVLKQELDACASVSAERSVAERFTKTVTNELVMQDIADYLTGRWSTSSDSVQNFLHVAKQNTDIIADFKTPEQCLSETTKMLQTKGIEFGLSTLDKGLPAGGRREDVTIVGAYSSVGKSWFACQMAVDLVVRQNKNVIFFSLEMSAAALFHRILSILLQKSTGECKAMVDAGDPFIYSVIEKLKGKLYVVDKDKLSIEEINEYIKTANAKLFDDGVHVVFIDYIQYMKGCSEYKGLAETAKGLKPTAKTNNVHLVALSQLKRGENGCTWEKPDMTDLKGGGDLESSGDNIFLMWKPGENPKLDPEEAEAMKDEVMLAIGKARHGQKIREIKMIQDKNKCRFIPAKI